MARLDSGEVATGIARALDEHEIYVGDFSMVQEARVDWMDGPVIVLSDLDDLILGRYMITVTEMDRANDD